MQRFTELKVWQRAHGFVLDVYRVTKASYSRFLNNAEASMAETEYLLMLSRDLGYVDGSTAEKLLAESNEVSSMLAKLRARVSETLNSQL